LTKKKFGLRETRGTLLPILRTVEYAGDFYHVFRDVIDDDVRQGREDKLSPSSHPAAGAAHEWKLCEAFASAVNRLRHAPRCLGVIALDPFANALKVIGRR
jgi:hypothetical protein